MANDAMDIKESLGAHHIKAPTPPTGATKEERLKEAQAHIAAAAVQPGMPVAPGLTTVRTIRDAQFGHLVEVHDLPLQAPGLGPDPAVVTTSRVSRPEVQAHVLAEKDDPGNIRLLGTLDVTHQPAAKK